MSASSIMHHPQATQAVDNTTTVAAATVRDRRVSTNSDSSVEPMEISQHTATSASDANNSSSLILSKSSHDQHSSEEEDNNNNNPLKKLYIKTRRGLVNGQGATPAAADEDADAEEEDKYTTSWRRDKEQQGNYLTILRKKGRYSSSRGGSGTNATAAEEKWNGKDEFEAAIQHSNAQSAPSDVTCRICSKVKYRFGLLYLVFPQHLLLLHFGGHKQTIDKSSTRPSQEEEDFTV